MANNDPVPDRKIDAALALLIRMGLVYTEVNGDGEVVYKAVKCPARPEEPEEARLRRILKQGRSRPVQPMGGSK
jgi:hypothetical protein